MPNTNTKKNQEEENIIEEAYEFFQDSYAVNAERIGELWRFYKMYHGYNYRDDIDPRRSNPFLMRTFALVETEMARYITALFNSPPLINMLPKNARAMDTVSKAENVNEMYLNKASIFKRLSKLIKLMLLFDDAWIVPSWCRKMGRDKVRQPITFYNQKIGEQFVEAPRVVYDGLDLKVYPSHSVYPDPYKESVQEGRGPIIEEWVYLESLRQMQDYYGFKNLDKLEEEDSRADESPEVKARTEIGLSAPYKNSKLIRLWYYFKGDQIHTIGNERVYLGVRNGEMPGVKQIIQATKTHDPLSTHGFGLIRPNEKTQRLLNMVAKQILDYNNVTINPFYIYKKGGSVDPNSLISYPGQRIGANNPMQDVNIWTPQGQLSLPFQILSFLNQIFDETVGVYGYQRGDEPASKTQTATVGSILASQGDLRIRYDILTFEYSTLIPLAKQCFKLIQMNMPERVWVRFIGSDMPQEVEVEELQEDFDYFCRGSSSMIKDIKRQLFLQVYNLVAPHPLLNDPNNPQAQIELMKRLFEYFEEGPLVNKLLPQGGGMPPVTPDLQNALLGAIGMGGQNMMPPQNMPQPRNQEEFIDFQQSQLRPKTGRTSRVWGGG